MMDVRKFLAVMTLAACSLVSAREFVVPYAEKAPAIDGRLSASEWSNALVISGTGDTIDHRKAEMFLCWDEKNLYGAVRTETPPRGKLVTSSGTNPVNDDSVEFWFDPPKELRIMEQWKFGEFQMILSHNGRKLLAHYNPGYGLPKRNWIVGDMKVVNKVENDQWVCEFSIPAKAFGMSSIPEMSLPMLSCVNFRSTPRDQIPFLSVADFMDSRSYPVFKLQKNVPSVRQVYAGNSRFPLKFESSGALTYEAVINGKTVTGTLPVTLNAAAPSTVSMKVKNGGTAVFQRSFKLTKPPERLWDTPESYIVLEQDFESGVEKFVEAPKGAAVEFTGKAPSIVPGRKEGSKAVHFEEGAKTIRIRNGKIPVPGNISIWMKKDEATKSGYVRYFSTQYEPAGYFGVQDHPGFLLLFMEIQKKAKDYTFSRRPMPGVWSHLSLNIQPDKVEFYCNGILISERNLPFVVDPSKLGNFQLGGGAGFGGAQVGMVAGHIGPVLLFVKTGDDPGQGVVVGGQGEGPAFDGGVEIPLAPVFGDVPGVEEAGLPHQGEVPHAGGVVRQQHIGALEEILHIGVIGGVSKIGGAGGHGLVRQIVVHPQDDDPLPAEPGLQGGLQPAKVHIVQVQAVGIAEGGGVEQDLCVPGDVQSLPDPGGDGGIGVQQIVVSRQTALQDLTVVLVGLPDDEFGEGTGAGEEEGDLVHLLHGMLLFTLVDIDAVAAHPLVGTAAVPGLQNHLAGPEFQGGPELGVVHIDPGGHHVVQILEGLVFDDLDALFLQKAELFRLIEGPDLLDLGMLLMEKLGDPAGGVGILPSGEGDEIDSVLQGQHPEELQCVLNAMLNGVFDPLFHLFTQ